MDDLHDIKQSRIINLKGILTMEEITTNEGNTFHFFDNDKFAINGSNNGTYKINFAKNLDLYLNANGSFYFFNSGRISPGISLISETNEIEPIINLIRMLKIKFSS